MKNVAPIIIAAVGLVAIVAITIVSLPPAESARLGMCFSDDAEQSIEPASTVRVGRQFRVNCASVDAGTATTELLVPVDGGTAGKPMEADTLYVAPISGSSVKVRVGFNDSVHGNLTSSTGFQVGASARDGAGVSIETRQSASPRCKSEGAAQAVDVVVGRF